MRLYLKKIINKFRYAVEGCINGMKHDKSIQLQGFISIIVILLGFCFRLQVQEWMIIVLMIGFVVALEYINSAVEHIVDMISPEYHPTAKIIKDYVAAAVLIASITAFLMAVFIFINRI